MKKTCPYCAEEVMTAAKICPHCRNWLSKYSLRNPAVLIICFCLLMLIGIFGFLYSAHQFLNPGRDYSPFRDSLSVLETRMNFKPDEYGDCIYVVVVLTNKCVFTWKNPQLDIRFYDKAGTLIDANSNAGGGLIQSLGDMAVRVECRPCHPLSEYDSCKVFVRGAVDPIVRF